SEHVVWLGFLSGEPKLQAMRAASVFALPSYSENFGIALVEALAAGMACVISDQIGIAPDVEAAGAGVVTPCEPGPLAAALGRALGDPQLSARLAANAKRLAQERYSLEAMTTSLSGLYRSIVPARATPVPAALPDSPSLKQVI